jgi:hypothetical protein
MEIFHVKVAELLASPMTRAEKAKVLACLIRSERNFQWVGLYGVSATHISAIAGTGSEPPAFPIFPVTKGINGAAVAQRVPVVVQDVFTDSRHLTTFGAARREAISLCSPPTWPELSARLMSRATVSMRFKQMAKRSEASVLFCYAHFGSEP